MSSSRTSAREVWPPAGVRLLKLRCAAWPGVELLILDDLALQPLDATETADFYQLCVERHRKTATVVTSNRTPENGCR